MDKRISDMNTLGTPDDSDYMEVLDSSEILPNNSNKKMTLLTLKNWLLTAFNLPQHKNTHVVGGTDAFLITDLIDAIARFRIKLGNVLTGTRRGINFIPGTNVTITTLDDIINDQVNVTINATNNGGDVTDGSNLGGQNEVFVNKTAGILNYRTIQGTGATSVSTVGNVIQINTPASTGEANTMSNVGTGAGNVFRDKTGVNLNVKTLNAGSNIQIIDNPNDITISTTARNNTGVNLGTGANVYVGMSGDVLQFKTIDAIGLTITQTPTSILFQNNMTTPLAANLGTGEFVYKNFTSNTYNFKSIKSGVGINVISNTNEVVINNLYTFGTQWLSNNTTTKLNDSFIQDMIHTNILTSAMAGSGVLSSITTSCTINGNYNTFTTRSSTDTISVGANDNVIFINCRFVNNIDNLNESLMNITSGIVYFKNCTFYNKENNNAPDIIISNNAAVIFEDCYFSGTSTSRTSEHIKYMSYTGISVFNNCIIGAGYTPTLSYCMTSDTPINIQLLGNNYALKPQDANITFTIGTLTTNAFLKYIPIVQ